VLGILGLCLAACSRHSSLSPFESEITRRLGNEQCVIGSPLQVWTNALGQPSTVTQSDGGNTFFYWQDRGIAVFCHPLYQGQYDRRKRPDWIVTSIFVPLQTNLHPRIPPVHYDTRITFTRLLFNRHEVVQTGWRKLSNIRAFEQDGVLEALAIEKPDSFLGDYE
jgi:hypothetical protein